MNNENKKSDEASENKIEKKDDDKNLKSNKKNKIIIETDTNYRRDISGLIFIILIFIIKLIFLIFWIDYKIYIDLICFLYKYRIFW